MPALLIAGGSALGGAGSIFSGIFGAAGAKQQAAAIREAAEIARRTALQLNKQARADVAPFREFGIESGNTFMDLLLGKGDLSSTIKESPLFEFQSELGMRNINRELSARGLFGSGAGLETLQRFNTQLVGEEGERIMSRLFGMTQLGSNAAAQSAQMTSNTGNNLANMELQAGLGIGQAKANQYNAIGQAVSGGFNAVGNAMGNYGQFQAFQPLLQNLSSGGRFNGATPTTMGNGLTGFSAGGNPFLVNSLGLTGS